jgi:hypothetical protein
VRRLTEADTATVNAWLKRDSGEDADFGPFLANPMNVCLAEGDGGALFVWRGPGIYEVHVAFEHRGREVIEISRRMLAWMRANGAWVFWAAVPVESRHVIMFTRLMGWESQGFADLPHGRCELFVGE